MTFEVDKSWSDPLPYLLPSSEWMLKQGYVSFYICKVEPDKHSLLDPTGVQEWLDGLCFSVNGQKGWHMKLENKIKTTQNYL